MQVDIITIFPEYFAPLELSLIGRARAAGRIEINVYDLRQWTHDVHRSVDDTPYGGGPGMVMRPEPWGEAFDALLPPAGPALPARVLAPSPAGVLFTQSLARELAGEQRLIFMCGRYEGIDQRVLDHVATRTRIDEISIGDFVLFGGEVAALVVIEAVTRLLPGVLGNIASLIEESHTDGLLEAPVYTKPATWRGLAVPEVLRSGDHRRIGRWRRAQALHRTVARRPDLITAGVLAKLDKDDIALLTGSGFSLPECGMAE